MLIAKEHCLLSPALSLIAGLTEDTFGAILAEDEHGKHFTLVTLDVEYWRMTVDAPHHVRAGMEVPAHLFPLIREGWPDEWNRGVENRGAAFGL